MLFILIVFFTIVYHIVLPSKETKTLIGISLSVFSVFILGSVLLGFIEYKKKPSETLITYEFFDYHIGLFTGVSVATAWVIAEKSTILDSYLMIALSVIIFLITIIQISQ